MALRFAAKRGSVSTRVDRLLTPTKENPVEMNIVNEVALLQRLSIAQLRQRFAELFGEATAASNRTWLVKRIVWRMQALAEGDLSQRARRRAQELVRDADLRLNPPRPKTGTPAQPQALVAPTPSAADPRLPPPGVHRIAKTPSLMKEKQGEFKRSWFQPSVNRHPVPQIPYVTGLTNRVILTEAVPRNARAGQEQKGNLLGETATEGPR